MTISDKSRNYGKFTDGATSDPEEDCFHKWQQHWDWCISAGGEYFVSNMAHSVAGMFKKL
jgi:hypothetical protein